jgi:HAD superfamily hydrolase (TIGR01509 family)
MDAEVPRPLPAAVLFDNDGLLLDTEALWTRAETRLFERRERSFGLDEKRVLLGSSPAQTAERLEHLLEAEGEGMALMEELHELAAEEFEGEVEAMEGAHELLAALGVAGIPLGLVSNSPRELVSLALQGSGLVGAFEVVVTAGEGVAGKPEPDLYLAGCRLLEAHPQSSVALEDTPVGVAAARAAGMGVVGVPSLPGLDLSEADLIAPSLADRSVWRFLGLTAG